MSFNGSGVFSRVYSWVSQAALGFSIDAAKMDADTNDIATALSNVVCRDGQGVPTADIPWGNHKITGLATPTAAQDAATLATAQSFANDGQCYFQFTNGTTCTLVPRNGGSLWINGAPQTIPSAGVTLSSTGGVSGGGNVVAGTKYFVYAYMNAGVMTLEAATTGYTVDSSGRANKTGDTTRRLVGMVYPSSGTPGIFTNTAVTKNVASYFNRVQQFLLDAGGGSTASTTPTAFSGVLSFLVWSGDVLQVSLSGYAYNNTAGNTCSAYTRFDGSTQIGPSSQNFSPNGNTPGAVSANAITNPTEGNHYTQTMANVSAGTGQWFTYQYVVVWG